MREGKLARINQRSIAPFSTLLDAFKVMDQLGVKLLLVIENDKYMGLLSSGDVQRAILGGKSLERQVVECMRSNARIADPNMSVESLRSMMLEHRMEFCPVVDEYGRLLDVHFWEDHFETSVPHPSRTFDLPVVIMAGGKGTRMRPITHVLPKPLIPIKEKTMLEEIIDRFSRFGTDQFYVSVNYKSGLIRYYFDQLGLKQNVDFFEESKPLGTAGSLSLLNGKISSTFFVSNCDILIEDDYGAILDYHEQNDNEITIVGAVKTYEIPYGTLDVAENGLLQSLQEKPSSTVLINSGMYILEPHLIKEVPSDTLFHITDLIGQLMNEGRKVGVYPVSDGSWVDMGNWVEYRQNTGL